ncbi:MAG: nucleotidyltransferase family protein [Mariprofundus sp.]
MLRSEKRLKLTRIVAGLHVVDAQDIADADLMSVAYHEGMNGILWQKIISSERVEAEYSAVLSEQVHALQLRYLRMQHTCASVLSSLNHADIIAMLMRGISLTESLYGKQSALRPISDMDLLIDVRQMSDAKQVLWDIGFRPDRKYSHIYYRGDISIDLHHEPLGIERITMWKYLTPLRMDDFVKYAQEGVLAGEPALLLQPRINLPYLCFHALKHSFERLVWLYDIALLANRVAEDDQWDTVLDGIHEYRLERPCFYALAYVKAHLDASVPADILEKIKPDMGVVERSLFRRHMNHEVIPFLAERLFARMMPDFKHRMAFWRETIYPRYEVRAQMVESGCVKCNFIRKRIKQLTKAAWLFARESIAILR